MAYPGAKQINVNISFPNNDPHARPTVSNSTSEVDEVAASYDSVEWSAVVSGPNGDDNLKIDSVTFYTDASKTTTTTPAFFGQGFNSGRTNYVLPFNGTAVPSEVALIYTVNFEDDDYTDLVWDPTVKIKPRTAAEGAAGAGGN